MFHMLSYCHHVKKKVKSINIQLLEKRYHLQLKVECFAKITRYSTRKIVPTTLNDLIFFKRLTLPYSTLGIVDRQERKTTYHHFWAYVIHYLKWCKITAFQHSYSLTKATDGQERQTWRDETDMASRNHNNSVFDIWVLEP